MGIDVQFQGWCSILSYIGFFLFFLTTVKSVWDLVFSELIHRDIDLLKINWRKLFHLLLPLSQVTFCVSCILYSMYCQEINKQDPVNTALTSTGGYILVLCFFINALHWAFLTSQGEHLKLLGLVIGIIFIFFIIIPVCLLVSICYFYGREKMRDRVHGFELYYASGLNIFVVIVVSGSWWKLHRRLKEFSGLHTIISLRKRLRCQMFSYIVFFLIRAICLIFCGVLENDKYEDPLWMDIGKVLFFISALFGDVPLAFVMLHFLKPGSSSSSSSSSSTTPTTSLSSSFASTPQQQQTHPGFQYTQAVNEDISYTSGMAGQVVPNNDVYLGQDPEIVYTNTPPEYYNNMLSAQNTPFYYNQQPGIDPSLSTNSFYVPDGGYV